MRIGKQFLFAKPKKVRTRNNPQNYKPEKLNATKHSVLVRKSVSVASAIYIMIAAIYNKTFLILLGHFSTA